MSLKRIATISLLLLGILVLVAACTRQQEVPRASLPPGFADTPLPNVLLNGYVFMSTGELVEGDVDGLTPGVALGQANLSGLKVRNVSIFVGPTAASHAVGAQFSNADSAREFEQILAKEARGQFEHFQLGDKVYIIWGGGDWASGLQESLKQGRTKDIATTYPDLWRLFNSLPNEPKQHVFGAGFGIVDDAFISSIERTVGVDLSTVKTAAANARVQNVVIGLYAKNKIRRFEALNGNFLKNMGLSAMGVTRSGYPSIVVNAAFRGVASQAGLTEISLPGPKGTEKAFYLVPLEGLHGVLRNKGNIFLLSIATSREAAEELMATSLR